MKFSFTKTILICLFLFQIIVSKYDTISTNINDFAKVPGSSRKAEKMKLEARFKSKEPCNSSDNDDDTLVNSKFNPGANARSNNVKSNNLKPKNGKNNKKNNSNKPINVVDLNSPEVALSEWMTVYSGSFQDAARYPVITMEDGREIKIKTRNDQRLNENFAAAKADGAPSEEAFWFVMKNRYIYYFSSKKDINVLDSIYIKTVQNKRNHYNPLSGTDDSCLEIIDMMDRSYTVCSSTKELKFTWLCSIQKLLDIKQEPECIPIEKIEKINRKDLDFSDYKPVIEEKKDVQPVIIIPTGGRKCNDGWNYNLKGADWECTCKEGLKQSPIDLPHKDLAEITPVHPFFEYYQINSISDFDTYDGYYNDKQNIKITYMKGAIRILHPKLGKIVTDDGGVYVAEEITFHTPSEHKINGERFDLEMQVIHYGRSEGDIAKQVVVSFLFKKTPGIYNKLLDSINFTNLPNPVEKTKFIDENFSILQVLYTPDEEMDQEFKWFSFYSYEGSLTFPPCTERTTHLVVADPIPLSSTVITLFQEALLVPDLLGSDIGFSTNKGSIENYREIQPLNGRNVSIFNHYKFGCGKIKEPVKKETGHYEKRPINVPHYIFINSNEPSGIPGAVVVDEDEAKAIVKNVEEKEGESI